MFKKFKKIISIASISFLFVTNVYAAQIFWENQDRDTNDKNIDLNLYLNSEKEEINVLEGKIKVVGPAKIINVDKNNSIFSLWPEEPNINDNELSFVGGSLSGVWGNKMKIFSVGIQPNGNGEISVVAENLNLYLNDGKGTIINIESESWEKNTTNFVSNKNNLNWYVILVSVIILTVIAFILFFKKRK